MSGKSATIIVVLACAMWLAGTSAFAQATGQISGRITDATGAVLPGVTVEATSPALRACYTA